MGRRMDWLIYNLTGDVLTHYWYNVQYKAYGFIRNNKHEGIVAFAIIKANDILDTNVLICMDKDVAYVGSVNNRPKLWTIKRLDSEWAQCDCPVAKEGMICKHTVKVFKMLHPGVDDGVIVCEVGTKHGTQCATPMAHCYTRMSQQTIQLHVPSDVDSPFVVELVMQYNVIHIDINEELTPLPHLDSIFVDSKYPSQFSSQFTLNPHTPFLGEFLGGLNHHPSLRRSPGGGQRFTCNSLTYGWLYTRF